MNFAMNEIIISQSPFENQEFMDQCHPLYKQVINEILTKINLELIEIDDWMESCTYIDDCSVYAVPPKDELTFHVLMHEIGHNFTYNLNNYEEICRILIDHRQGKYLSDNEIQLLLRNEQLAWDWALNQVEIYGFSANKLRKAIECFMNDNYTIRADKIRKTIEKIYQPSIFYHLKNIIKL